MSNESIIQIFEGVNVRIVWNEEEQEYYFAVADIVQVLTDTANPRDYIKKMLKRDEELKFKWGTICPPVRMLAPDGKYRMTQAATLEGIFRLIQSIPSKKTSSLRAGIRIVVSLIKPSNNATKEAMTIAHPIH